MKYILLALVTLSLHLSAFASPQMKKLFTESFHTKYVAADCLMNIARLLEDAEKLKININNANVLYMTNEGTSMFGHIKGEYARGRTAVSDRSWYFHVVLEMDGMIYDFDYGQTPLVVPVRTYFDKMFLSEKITARRDFKYIGPERKLEDYQVKVMDGLSVARAKSRHDMPKGELVRFGEYLKRF